MACLFDPAFLQSFSTFHREGNIIGTHETLSLSLTEIEDDFPSHVEIPDFFFPVAQADITECSTYTVVCRLKVSPTYSITSKGGSFSHPDYPGVTVTIPENAVAPNAEFPLELKVGLTFTTHVVVFSTIG